MNSGGHSGYSNQVLQTLKGNHKSLFSKAESALLIFGKDVNKQDRILGQKTENKGNGEEALKSLTSKEMRAANHACIFTRGWNRGKVKLPHKQTESLRLGK